MKRREWLLETLEQRIGGVESPTADEIQRYLDWVYRNRVLRTFVRWFKNEREQEFGALTQEMVDNRKNQDALQKITDEVIGGYRGDFIAAKPPLAETSPYLDSWQGFARDNPDLQDKRAPTEAEIMAVLKAE